MPLVQRPDQRPVPTLPGIPGSRSGSSEQAGATQAAGVPPFIPNAVSVSSVGAGPQVPTTFFTFAKQGRVWAATLSFALGSNASYVGGVTQVYAQVKTSGGAILGYIELAVSAIGQAVNGQDAGPGVGQQVPAGTHLQLDVNNGVGLASGGGVMRATCAVLYSIP